MLKKKLEKITNLKLYHINAVLRKRFRKDFISFTAYHLDKGMQDLESAIYFKDRTRELFDDLLYTFVDEKASPIDIVFSKGFVRPIE